VAPGDGELPADRLKHVEPFARLGAALNQAGVRMVHEPPKSRPLDGLPEFMSMVNETVRSAIHETLTVAMRDSLELTPMLADLMERLREERSLQQEELAASERSLQSLRSATQRLENLLSSTQQGMAGLLERETATVTAARRQLWDEAAAFKHKIRHEIRWLVRAPLVAVMLLAIVCGLLWNQLEAERRTKDTPPPAKPAPRLEKSRR
jgi:hypothetical protein